MNAAAKNPVVFVHGLWLHAESWNPWIAFFQEHGYQAQAASWPGDAATTEATRRNAGAVAGYVVGQIAEHIAGAGRAHRAEVPVHRSIPCAAHRNGITDIDTPGALQPRLRQRRNRGVHRQLRGLRGPLPPRTAIRR